LGQVAFVLKYLPVGINVKSCTLEMTECRGQIKERKSGLGNPKKIAE